MSNAIPSGWVESSLEPYCEKITDGAHLSPPTSSEGFPIATVENMRARHIDIQSCRTISKSDFESLQRNSCAPELGDVLFSKDGTIGKTFVFQQRVDVVLLSSIAIIRTKKAKLVPEFLTQYLKSPFFFRSIEHATSGSAIRRVVLKDIKALSIKLPPVLEQQKIASILTAVDEVIVSTTAQINKLKDLKTGMMQELLTKGIGNTEFKDSPLGRIPKEWEVGIMRDICTVRQGLQIPISNRFRERGANRFPYLTIRFINTGFDEKVAEFIENPSDRVLCKKDDILLARTGATGKVVTNVNGVFHNNFFMVDYFREKVSKIFLCQYLNSPFIQTEIENRAGTTTIPDLNHGDFYSLPMLIPSIQEQTRIADVLSSIDLRIIAIERKYTSIKNIKRGLMQDLLTGNTRVKIGRSDLYANEIQ
jgi:type I restriction enzyme S subunit